MRYIFVFIIFILLLSSCTTSTNEKNVIEQKSILSDQIVYDAHIISHEGLDNDWYENLEETKRKEFVTDIILGVKEGKLKAYIGPIGMPSNVEADIITYSALIELISDTLVINNVDSVTGNNTVTFVVLNESNIHEWISRVTFCERWLWDKSILKMKKEVIGLALSKTVMNDFSEVLGYQRLFWVWFEDNYEIKGLEEV